MVKICAKQDLYDKSRFLKVTIILLDITIFAVLLSCNEQVPVEHHVTYIEEHHHYGDQDHECEDCQLNHEPVLPQDNEITDFGHKLAVCSLYNEQTRAELKTRINSLCEASPIPHDHTACETLVLTAYDARLNLVWGDFNNPTTTS